jgi:hypothetical protein
VNGGRRGDAQAGSCGIQASSARGVADDVDDVYDGLAVLAGGVEVALASWLMTEKRQEDEYGLLARLATETGRP